MCRVGGGAPGVTGLGPCDPGTPGPQQLLGKLRCRMPVPVLCGHTAAPFARTSPPFGTSHSAPTWARGEVDPCTWGGRVTRAARPEGGVIRALGHAAGQASSSPSPSEVGGLDSCKVFGAHVSFPKQPHAACWPREKQRAGRGAACGPSRTPYSCMPRLSQSRVPLCATMPYLCETGLPPGSRFTDVRPRVGQEPPEKPHQWDARVRAHSVVSDSL